MGDLARIRETIDGLLAAIAEVVHRSDEAARSLRSGQASGHLVHRLEAAGAELNAAYVRLFRASAFGPEPATPVEQLELLARGRESAPSWNEDGTIPSAVAPTLARVNDDHDQMNEEHMAEVERVLFLMSETRRRAERAALDLARAGAEPYLVEAVEQAERELEATIDAFFKGTYFHVPKDQLSLS